MHGGHRHRCHRYCHHCKRDYHPNWTKGAVYGALLIAGTDAKDENNVTMTMAKTMTLTMTMMVMMSITMTMTVKQLMLR